MLKPYAERWYSYAIDKRCGRLCDKVAVALPEGCAVNVFSTTGVKISEALPRYEILQQPPRCPVYSRFSIISDPPLLRSRAKALPCGEPDA